MTIYLPELSLNSEDFPPCHEALDEPDGLLAMGGDLHPKRILAAYNQGIFPWFSDGDPILWWSPQVRALFDPKTFKPSKSLKKFFRKSNYRVSINLATHQIIGLCASTRPAEETWILPEMQHAYQALANLGHCHSIEVWQDNAIIGGLYGLQIGQVFCGESMFSLKTNASKIALWHLCEHLNRNGGVLIDCQMMNDHLESLGAIECERSDFLQELSVLRNKNVLEKCYQPQWLANPRSKELT